MSAPVGLNAVLVDLGRPPGYEDIHPELVAVDALDSPSRPPWPHTIVSADATGVVIALERPDGYEDVPARELAAEAISPSWPHWQLRELP